MDKITYSANSKGITITIPTELMVFASENRGDLKADNFKVVQPKLFMQELAAAIENDEDPDTGLTKFQQLLDDYVDQLIEDDSEAVSYNEE